MCAHCLERDLLLTIVRPFRWTSDGDLDGCRRVPRKDSAREEESWTVKVSEMKEEKDDASRRNAPWIRLENRSRRSIKDVDEFRNVRW